VDESNLPVPEAKSGFLEWLANKFGLPFALPTLALPQTIKNADKALGRLIAAGLDNVAGRIERNTAIRGGKTEAELKVIKAAAGQLAAQSKTDPYLTERALEYTFGETVLKQKNREQVGRLALEHLNATAKAEAGDAGRAGPDATSEIDDDWLNAFSDHVSAKSDADVQSLWAKILSNEIRKPRSFSLQSLRLLADLSADDARLLHDKILPLVVAETIIFSEGISDLTEFIRAQELGALMRVLEISLSFRGVWLR
jgi:predicted 3-demethylubiquinone-9 3-methyltransferase (glyoxalase superfamily)